MPKPTILRLQAYGSPVIEGQGEELTYVFTAYEVKRTGRRIDYCVEVKGCRHSVRQLAEQIANMQVRDLQSIERLRARLDREVEPVKRS